MSVIAATPSRRITSTANFYIDFLPCARRRLHRRPAIYDALDSSAFKFVIASDSEATQIFLEHLDCFVAYAPRNDELIRCSCASIVSAASAGSTHSNCGS
jgi:hypothetical protein